MSSVRLPNLIITMSGRRQLTREGKALHAPRAFKPTMLKHMKLPHLRIGRLEYAGTGRGSKGLQCLSVLSARNVERAELTTALPKLSAIELIALVLNDHFSRLMAMLPRLNPVEPVQSFHKIPQNMLMRCNVVRLIPIQHQPDSTKKRQQGPDLYSSLPTLGKPQRYSE
jgi:hypothetical protein